MARQTINIIGAGLSGLTLGRCLHQRGISAVLYDRKSAPPTHNYGITLYASTYIPLLSALGVDEHAFKSRLAVDAAIGGMGKINNAAPENSNEGPCFRANRGKLEEWLREGLNVKQNHVLQHVECSPSSPPSLRFENGQQVRDGIVVGADGPHSSLRTWLLPDSKLDILPYVVFNGKRRVNRSEFEEKIQPHLQDSTAINFRHKESRLNVSINEYQSELVSISWTYSRPSRGTEDALHQPDRALSNASVIPKELFQELDIIHQTGLPQPFSSIFEPGAIKDDRILHWLMRTTHLPQHELETLAQQSVVLLGDAAHAEPIVGGNGANNAIRDALSLAAHLAKNQPTSALNLPTWLTQTYPQWSTSVQTATCTISSLHSPCPPDR
ncbi:hypothetical protein BDU57DRAFT_139969 [Ampelomyces quisqualis]|uniref:FAD-binding domain-containing protein n=1 Tax=Ampelomyces quisqualis TaxID=50730 RepID=A0A6A5QWS2_AMPQU|nr:hypothetical protein BDU57DRAFT_139969 [Ampelomyces quisqualis]